MEFLSSPVCQKTRFERFRLPLTSSTRCVHNTRFRFSLTCLKSPWEEVRREMTVDKGLDGEIADRIGEYVKLKGEFSGSAGLQLYMLSLQVPERNFSPSCSRMKS